MHQGFNISLPLEVYFDPFYSYNEIINPIYFRAYNFLDYLKDSQRTKHSVYNCNMNCTIATNHLKPYENLLLPNIYLDQNLINSFCNVPLYDSQHVQNKLLKYIIDIYMQNSLTSIGKINWWACKPSDCQNSYNKLWVINTKRDGNCLLHALSLALYGFEDSNLALRKLLHKALQNDSHTKFNNENNIFDNGPIKQRWVRRQNQLNTMYGLSFSPEEWETEWNSIIQMASLRHCDSSNHYFASLEEIHIYVMANVLNAPIILFAPDYLLDSDGQPISPINFSGIYLPFDAHNFVSPPYKDKNIGQNPRCSDPIFLAYHSSHFSPLTLMLSTMNNGGENNHCNTFDVFHKNSRSEFNEDVDYFVEIPLCDASHNYLPILFTNEDYTRIDAEHNFTAPYAFDEPNAHNTKATDDKQQNVNHEMINKSELRFEENPNAYVDILSQYLHLSWSTMDLKNKIFDLSNQNTTLHNTETGPILCVKIRIKYTPNNYNFESIINSGKQNALQNYMGNVRDKICAENGTGFFDSSTVSTCQAKILHPKLEQNMNNVTLLQNELTQLEAPARQILPPMRSKTFSDACNYLHLTRLCPSKCSSYQLNNADLKKLSRSTFYIPSSSTNENSQVGNIRDNFAKDLFKQLPKINLDSKLVSNPGPQKKSLVQSFEDPLRYNELKPNFLRISRDIYAPNTHTINLDNYIANNPSPRNQSYHPAETSCWSDINRKVGQITHNMLAHQNFTGTQLNNEINDVNACKNVLGSLSLSLLPQGPHTWNHKKIDGSDQNDSTGTISHDNYCGINFNHNNINAMQTENLDKFCRHFNAKSLSRKCVDKNPNLFSSSNNDKDGKSKKYHINSLNKVLVTRDDIQNFLHRQN